MIQPESEPHRRGRISTPAEIADGETASLRCAGGFSRKEAIMSTEKDTKLSVFEGRQIRKTFHNGEWWFSIMASPFGRNPTIHDKPRYIPQSRLG